MKKYQRICIIGNSGSGKSTFATQLAKITSLPLIHLDKLFWRPGWLEATDEEFTQELSEVLETKSWIIDGNYKKTLVQRLSQADLVVIFDYSPVFCLYRVLKRMLTTTTRPDMAEGCAERFNLSFYKYVLTYNRCVRPQVMKLLQNGDGDFDLILLQKTAEAEKLLTNFASEFAHQ